MHNGGVPRPPQVPEEEPSFDNKEDAIEYHLAIAKANNLVPQPPAPPNNQASTSQASQEPEEVKLAEEELASGFAKAAAAGLLPRPPVAPDALATRLPTPSSSSASAAASQSGGRVKAESVEVKQEFQTASESNRGSKRRLDETPRGMLSNIRRSLIADLYPTIVDSPKKVKVEA